MNRKVKATISTKSYEYKGITTGNYEGVFRGFFQEGNLEDGIDVVALVEIEIKGIGQIVSIPATYVSFVKESDK